MAESKSFSDASHALNELSHALAMLESENSNLRALLRYLYKCQQTYYKTSIYPVDYGRTEQRMRELGIEVQDDS